MTATITYSVYSAGGAVVGSLENQSLVVSSVIYDTLQGWPQDATGYNFLHAVGPTGFPSTLREVWVQYVITLSAGLGSLQSKLVFHCTILPDGE